MNSGIRLLSMVAILGCFAPSCLGLQNVAATDETESGTRHDASGPTATQPANGAVSEQDWINLLHQRQWVRLDANRSIQGHLKTLSARGDAENRAGATIIISKNGETLSQTKSGFDGKFSFEELDPGTYALMVNGEVTFAAYALHVLPNNASHLSSDLVVYASAVRRQRARALVAESFVPAELNSEDWDAGNSEFYREFKTDPLAKSRRFNGTHQVALRDGKLVGRISRPGWRFMEQDLTGTVAKIVKNSQVLHEVSVGQDGYFVIEEFKPGIYDLFVSGEDGFAVLAFEAVSPSEMVGVAESRLPRFVGLGRRHRQRRCSDCLCCELVQQPEVACCEEAVVEEVAAVEPCGCGMDPCGCDALAPAMGGGLVGGGGFYGGAGGGGFGGGGGGFGGVGGGLGGVAGIAGLAVGVAALADNDDGFNLNQATLIVP